MEYQPEVVELIVEIVRYVTIGFIYVAGSFPLWGIPLMLYVQHKRRKRPAQQLQESVGRVRESEEVSTLGRDSPVKPKAVPSPKRMKPIEIGAMVAGLVFASIWVSAIVVTTGLSLIAGPGVGFDFSIFLTWAAVALVAGFSAFLVAKLVQK